MHNLALLEHEARTDDDARSILADHFESIGRHDVAAIHRDQLPERGRTRRRVKSITNAERSKMAGWAERWIKVGLSTERADRPLFEAAVAACYRYTGLAAPKVIVWAPCPIVVAYAGSIASAWLKENGSSVRDSVHASVSDAVHDAVNASVHDAVGDSVRDSVRASVHASVSDSIHDAVHDSVNASVHASVSASVHDAVHDAVNASVNASVSASVNASVNDSVRDSVRASVNDSVRDSIHDAVHDSVHDSVHDAVGDSARDSVRASVSASVNASLSASVNASVNASVHDSVNASVSDSVSDSVHDAVHDAVHDSVKSVTNKTALDQWHLYQGGQFWVGGWYWGSPSYVSFMLDVLRLDIGREQELKARAYAATHESACWWWPSISFVIVSERPTVIEKHADGRFKRARWDWVNAAGEACSWDVER